MRERLAARWAGMNIHLKTIITMLTIVVVMSLIIFLSVITEGLFFIVLMFIVVAVMLYWLIYGIFEGDFW